MLMMRLMRIGRKNEPHFRVVVTDRRNAPKSGKFIEIVGSYNPKLGTVQLSADRVTHWISQGVQLSDTVYNFLVDQKLVPGRKKNSLPKKTAPVKVPEPVVEAPAPVTAEPAVEEAAPEVAETPAEVVEEVVADETPAAEVVSETETTDEPAAE